MNIICSGQQLDGNRVNLRDPCYSSWKQSKTVGFIIHLINFFETFHYMLILILMLATCSEQVETGAEKNRGLKNTCSEHSTGEQVTGDSIMIWNEMDFLQNSSVVYKSYTIV